MQRFDLKARLLHSNRFCCCVPVRAGFVLISILTFLFSGAVSVIIWFEVFNSYQLSTRERVAFILAGILESLLFVASIIGLIGVVARKQLFVMIYTYFLYIHFILNVIVGIYFLVTVRSSNRQQLVDYCAQVFVNTPTESSCTRLMSVSTYIFIAIVATLLIFELYGVLIATRYVHRLRMQKRDDRSRRLGYFHAFSKPDTGSTGHVRRASDDIELLRSTGDGQEAEDAVLDIGPEIYMPVLTYDRDVPSASAQVSSPQSPPNDSVRRVRALPPRPDATSPVATQTTNGDAVLPSRLEPVGRSWKRRRGEDEQSVLEVSPTAHSALMDHATYMGTTFSGRNF